VTDFESIRRSALSLGSEGSNADLGEALVLADYFAEQGNQKMVATVLDVAYGLSPDDKAIQQRRQEVLESFSVYENDIQFRYIPAGSFLMGSESGDPDEQPVHAVTLDEYWISEAPISWAHYCKLMDWKMPPNGFPDIEFDDSNRMQGFHLNEMNKIRYTYCETETLQGGEWHQHAHHMRWIRGGEEVTAAEIFGTPPRTSDEAPPSYHVKPMVAVGHAEVEDLCEKISTDSVRYELPSEAEWEKAARGALVGQPYSWGDSIPDPKICDCDHFGDWVIHDPLIYPPNGYGLHGMCGGVWEWTRDEYDALAYSKAKVPSEIADAERQRVLRGGSWIDCPQAVTVSFRMCRGSSHWKLETWGDHRSPTIGFRLCRKTIG